MTGSAYVERAAGWSHSLTLIFSRGPGDYDNAMRRMSDALGLRYRSIWALRYRPPKTLAAETYEPLRLAHDIALREADLAAYYTDVTSRIARLKAAVREELANQDCGGAGRDR